MQPIHRIGIDKARDGVGAALDQDAPQPKSEKVAHDFSRTDAFADASQNDRADARWQGAVG